MQPIGGLLYAGQSVGLISRRHALPNTGVVMSRYVSMMGCVLAVLLLACSIALPAEEKGDKGVLFEVPTSGKIMDVTYVPEFDEWWVKCREGNAISVYSYDKRHQKWGRARFIPVPPGEKAAKGKDALKPAATAGEQSQAAPATKEGKTPKPAEAKPEAKSPDGKAPQPHKQKWWDPLRLLKENK